MDTSFLADFQYECYNKVLEHIQNGEKRISVLMSPGTGKKTISYLLIKEMQSEKQVLYVTGNRHSAGFIEKRLEELGAKADVCVYSEMNTKDPNAYDVIFFYQLQAPARIIAAEQCVNYAGVTVSLISPYQETRIAELPKGIIAYGEFLSKAAFVYTAKTIIDIRDSVDASEEEKEYIRAQIRAVKNAFAEQEKQCLFRLMAVAKEKEALDKKIDSCQNELADMDQTKQLENQLAQMMAELERLRQEAKEKEAEIAKIQEENRKIRCFSEFQELLLNGVGISAEIVKEMFDQIETFREELQSELDSEDEEIQETALHKFQNKITDMVHTATKDFVQVCSQRYEEILINALTEDVWRRKLLDKSRAFLITAKANFDSLTKNPNIYDYSGVCLLVTKALEVETTRRFYDEYFAYLRSQTPNTALWPTSVRQRRGSQVLPDPVTEEEFTLGKIVPFMGIKRLKDSNGNVTGYRVVNRNDYNTFIDFAQQRLFSGLSRRAVEQKIEQDYLFVEKVRVDYRNPAAHKSALSAISAKDCIEYVIETQKMLRVMLEDMVL